MSRKSTLALILVLLFTVVGCAGMDKAPVSTKTADFSGDPFLAYVPPVAAMAPPNAEILEVGMARMDVSPYNSVRMGGYGVFFGSESAGRWSHGIHDPIYATAIAFVKDDSVMVLITLDLVGLVSPDVEDIRNGVASRLPFGPDRVMVSSTHTHHSPDTLGLWGTTLPPRSGRDEKYMKSMKIRAVEAAVNAYRNRKPAKVFLAIGNEDELHWNQYITEVDNAALDSTITYLRFMDNEGHVIGTLTNWACHPTAEGMDNRLISSDWVGAWRDKMDAAMPGVHMYVNGSIGASIQPSVPWRDKHIGTDEQAQGFVWTNLLGHLFADDVLELDKQAKPIKAVDRIVVRNKIIEPAMVNRVFSLAKVLGTIKLDVPEYGDPLPVRVTAASVGPIRFGTMPGEMTPQLGVEIRNVLGGEAQVLVGLGQDALGYMIEPWQYNDKRYAYEKLLCINPEIGNMVVNAHRQMAAK